MADQLKNCTFCGESRPLTDFSRQGKYRRSRCKDCQMIENRSYRESVTPEQWERYRAQKVEESYGLTRDQHIDLMLKQDNRCGICGELMLRNVVDHSHETGKVRGLLCHKCNTGLGKLGDNLDGLKKAIKYLEGAEC